MLDTELIFNLKNKYGNIYSVDVKGSTLVFRELTFSEYDQILHYQEIEENSSADIEDLIIQFSIVYPENFDISRIPAGNVSALAQTVLDISGITSAKLAKGILEEKREQANEVKNLMKAFVLATIHSYSPEQLEEMTFSELAEKVALAEKIIEIRQGMNGVEPNNLILQLIDPEEEAEKQKTRAARHNLSKKDGEAAYEDPIAQKLWGMR
jgi:hypothetical protein